MTARLGPWVRLWPVWAPAVLLCLVNAGVYVWLTSESMGRRASTESEVAELQGEIARLERSRQRALADRAAVEALEADLDRLYGEVFGRLDLRLTDILRAVGEANSAAGLRPASFRYAAGEQEDLELTRFQVSFGFDGRYEQVRRLLDALAESPQFLIVDRISFSGDDEAAVQELTIGLEVSTYVAEADRRMLEQLTGGREPGGAGGQG